MPKTTRITNPRSFLHGGNINQDGEEVHNHQEGEDHEDNDDDDSTSRVDGEHEG